MRKISILSVIYIASLLIYSSASAQEICGDGLDNDNDGYVDCFDDDCVSDTACDNYFFGQPIPVCSDIPTADPEFTVSLKYRTPNTHTMDNRQTPVVGDIDGDGMPEIIGRDDRTANTLYIFDGATGAHERTIVSPATETFLDAVAIGDIDYDGLGEIFIVSDNGNGNAAADQRRLYCYEHNGTLKWRSTVRVGYANGDDRWTPGLADFNGDDTVEVYLGNQIWNALTGVKITQGTNANNVGAHPGNQDEPFPAVADVLPTAFCADCAGLEMICSDQVYSVNIATGAMTVQVDMGAAFNDGSTSIADMDMDGDLDAVVCTRNGAGRGIVYIWDIQTATQIGTTFQIDNASAAVPNTTIGGHPNIADFDGDTIPEIGLAGEDVYVVIDVDTATNTLSELWSRVVNDNSERTGSSVFDFEGDGVNEVVYRDQDSLFVYEGPTGTTRAAFRCPAATRTDYPIVVDVDNDQQTDLVCACSNYIGVFSATTVPWVRSRSVYNQHSYFAVNVNDDLTIPATQQDHHIAWPPSNPMNFPLNNYLTQSTYLTIAGEPTFEASDDSVTIDDFDNDIDFSKCQDGSNDSISINPTIFNNGNRTVPANTKIALYNGNPFVTGSVLIDTFRIDEPVLADSFIQAGPFTISDQGGSFTLFLLIDDNGTGTLPISAVTSNHAECDYTNNLDSVEISACGLPAPGCVYAQLTGWFRADDPGMIANNSDGTDVDEWPASGFLDEISLDPFNASDKPDYKNTGFLEKFNYNPSIVNTATSDGFFIEKLLTDHDEGSFFSVVNQNAGSPDGTIMLQGMESGIFARLSSTGAEAFGGASAPFPSFTKGETTLIGLSGNGSNFRSVSNGLVSTPVAASSSIDADTFTLGSSFGSSSFEGEIAEAITYQDNLSNADLEKVVSYLNMKYGITYGNNADYGGTRFNYFDSQGSEIWSSEDTSDNGYNYHNDVVAIGRDDCSGLDQRKSKSQGDSAALIWIHGTDTANPAAFADNRSFLIIGHDTGSIDFLRNWDQPGGESLNNDRMNRVWRIQTSGTVGTVTILIDKTIFGGNTSPTNVPVLITSDTVVFNTTIHNFDSAGNMFLAQITPTNGNFLSFGFQNPNLLPIKLISFTGTRKGPHALLNWEVASELDNEYFELERSTDGLFFEPFARIPSIGDHQHHYTYQHLDPDFHTGTVYYRLLQKDFDGKKTYSRIVSVDFDVPDNNFVIYPNPNEGKFFIRFDRLVEENVQLRIFDAVGRVVDTRTFQGNNAEFEVDLNALSNGYYFVEITYGQNRETRRVVKH